MASDDTTPRSDEQAARWAVRAAYGELTDQTDAELHAWLAADRRNRGAYLRAQAGLYVLEDAVLEDRRALAPDNDNGMESTSPVARWGRRFAAGGLAIAASVTAFALLGLPLPLGGNAVEPQEIVTLKDGSVATLGGDARIAIAMTDDARTITILSGEAIFDVAHDAERPFVVRSGDVFAQATGTVYSVRRAGTAGGTVSVSEGSVLVWARDERDQAVLLHAGGMLTLDPGPARLAPRPNSPVGSLPPPEVAQISLDNVSIAAAAARFNRINRTRIVIADPEIAETRIVGLFNASDPATFARAAAALVDANIIVKEDEIVIKSKQNILE